MTRELRMAAELTQEQIASLIIAVEQFGDIIGDSRGVAGLHLNGNVAEWGELLGTWLDGYDEAAAPIKALHDANLLRLERLNADRWARRATGAA